MTQEATAAQQLQSLNQALINAFVQKEDAQAKLEQANESIRAIRNQLGGIQLGQKVQTDILAEQAAAAQKDIDDRRAAEAKALRDALAADSNPKLHDAVIREIHSNGDR